MAPDARSRAMSAPLNPKISDNTQIVPSPSFGGAFSYSTGVCENRIGLATPGIWTPSSRVRPICRPRARTWGSLNIWAMVLIGPQGTAAASKAATHAMVVRVFIGRARRAARSFRFSTRLRLLVKRWSLASSATPMMAQYSLNCRSVPTAMMMWPSAVSKVW